LYAGSKYHLFVEFYNPWCVYSRETAPEYSRLFQIYNSRNSSRRDILIARINGIKEQEISLPYNIHSFPSIVYFSPYSKEITSYFRGGLRTQHHLQQWVESLTKIDFLSENKSPTPNTDSSNDINQEDDEITVKAKVTFFDAATEQMKLIFDRLLAFLSESLNEIIFLLAGIVFLGSALVLVKKMNVLALKNQKEIIASNYHLRC
jgi:thiol-disulfide isomerase/thioredoxin